MKYGIVSGMTWAIDTIILGIALTFLPFSSPAAVAVAPIASAAFHDFFCAVWMWIYMGARGKLGATLAALRTRGGKAIILGALLGGPIGMTGYIVAINNIGPAYTAIISVFYPAFGAFLAFLLLKERMTAGQFIALLVALASVMVMGYVSSTDSTTANPALGLFGAGLCVVAWGSEAVIGAWGMREEAVDNETALHIRETVSAIAYLLIVVPLFKSLSFAIESFATVGNAVVLGAAFAGTVSYLFYYKAISKIGAARAMAANISYSAWAVVFALIFLRQIPSPITIVCCIVIICGTVLASADWRELSIRRKN